jgi:hypothetical protein
MSVVGKFCPRYSCVDKKDNMCASTRGFNQVTLADTCKKGEFCNVDYPPYAHLSETTKDGSFYCKQIPPKPAPTRFPGEQCPSNSECVKTGPLTGECKHGTCSGAGDSSNCSSHAECLAGLFCNNESKKCIPQKPFKSECTDSVQCENKYLCHKGLCQLTPYSLDLGEEVNEKDVFYNVMCKFGFTLKGKCSYLIQKENGEDGFIKCDRDDKCIYTFFGTGETLETPCSCGYNSEGQGYCKQGHNKSII